MHRSSVAKLKIKIEFGFWKMSSKTDAPLKRRAKSAGADKSSASTANAANAAAAASGESGGVLTTNCEPSGGPGARGEGGVVAAVEECSGVGSYGPARVPTLLRRQGSMRRRSRSLSTGRRGRQLASASTSSRGARASSGERRGGAGVTAQADARRLEPVMESSGVQPTLQPALPAKPRTASVTASSTERLRRRRAQEMSAKASLAHGGNDSDLAPGARDSSPPPPAYDVPAMVVGGGDHEDDDCRSVNNDNATSAAPFAFLRRSSSRALARLRSSR